MVKKLLHIFIWYSSFKQDCSVSVPKLMRCDIMPDYLTIF